MIYKELIGIPFKPDGNDLSGINCYNLVRKVYAIHGYLLPETNLSATACTAVLDNYAMYQIKNFWEEIKEPEILCCVAMNGKDPNFTNHVAAYIGNGKILHIHEKTNSLIERLYPYRKLVKGFYRFKGKKQCL